MQARAGVEAENLGLTGIDMDAHVKNSLYASFDAYGRATDNAALQEAKITTYQNDLNPTGNFGIGTAGAATQSFLQQFPSSSRRHPVPAHPP